MTDNTTQTEPTPDNASVFSIQRIYLKDCSFETPHTPDVFRLNWQPNVDFSLHIEHLKLAEEAYEVVVSGTATASIENKIAFLAEVKQAGIFTLKNIPEDQIPLLLNIICPNILFPYFRETISNLTVRGSFPQLTLEPINFEALYQQRIAEQAGTAEGSTTIQ